jgi:membrane protein implicated in regulation of membrane protease activity
VVLALCIVLAFFLPYPWWIVILVVGIVLEIGEVIWGLRLARRRAHGSLVGRDARVVEACRPEGKVRVRGELWSAVCPAGAEVGETVTIVGREELTLHVEPAARSSQREDEVTAADRFS